MQGCTPLMLASFYEKVDAVKFLLKEGADVNAEDIADFLSPAVFLFLDIYTENLTIQHKSCIIFNDRKTINKNT